MLVTVPDAGLHEVLASQALLLQLWPDATGDVMTLLQVLRLAAPSLADVILIGLVVLAGPATMSRSAIVLQCRRATAVAIGIDADGAPVDEPCTQPERVRQLEIRDLAVDGLSVLSVRSAAAVRR